jgi:hypothetical protein
LTTGRSPLFSFKSFALPLDRFCLRATFILLLLDFGYHGPGDDDLEGGILAVGIARGVVFICLFKMGVFDKAVVGKHDEGTLGRKFAKTGG